MSPSWASRFSHSRYALILTQRCLSVTVRSCPVAGSAMPAAPLINKTSPRNAIGYTSSACPPIGSPRSRIHRYPPPTPRPGSSPRRRPRRRHSGSSEIRSIRPIRGVVKEAARSRNPRYIAWSAHRSRSALDFKTAPNAENDQYRDQQQQPRWRLMTPFLPTPMTQAHPGLSRPERRLQSRALAVRHEARCRIPGTAGRNSKGRAWAEWLIAPILAVVRQNRRYDTHRL